ncbi:MAG: UDP-N-acetylglucosamine--dolichyl-phosphate N-acetylglucosaminyltransferase [Candidatus Woesearchaeota archaeon]|nr:UDP-N-acetylglucosamine--dolichyl-phosphate N-acetylglucosaminyltransferase [Candidatus Woesearchaeota archaeon]
MGGKAKISIVFPAYNEEKYITLAVKDFLSTDIVDEVIVIDNNSKDRTAKRAKKAGARVIKETRQGYGWAMRRGLKEAKGDIIITAEPDGTFRGKDIHKLLAYSDDLDVVFGTRTTPQLIHEGAKMDPFLELGNFAVAKLLQILHGGPRLTDVGCSMKLIKRPALKKVLRQFKVGGSHFSPEFMIVTIRSNLKCLEIPVNYHKRVGDSKITSDFWKSFKLGLVMIWLIISRKFTD